MIGSPGRSSFFSAPLGVSVLVGGVGGFVVAALGGLVGLGAGTAFVGRAVVVVVGGVLAFWVGGSPRRFRRTTRKKNFVLVWRVGGGVWGGGGGRLPPPFLPPLPLAHPAPTHVPPHLLILPPRVPHLLHPSPLRGPEVAQRHPYAAHHARSLPIVETSQESKAQGWISGHDAAEGPQGYFLGSFSVSPGHPDGPGIRRVDHDVNNLKKNEKKIK